MDRLHVPKKAKLSTVTDQGTFATVNFHGVFLTELRRCKHLLTNAKMLTNWRQVEADEDVTVPTEAPASEDSSDETEGTTVATTFAEPEAETTTEYIDPVPTR
jgi:hypothetical protein